MKIANQKLSSRGQSYVLAGLLMGLAAVAVGCGKQAYVVTASEAGQQAPGSFTVPPKVDILLVQDDTGSSRPIYSNISSQLGTLLSNVQGKGWDYHFATVPLTTARAISQVQASQYDSNWGSQWLMPYPGVNPATVAVPASTFRFPSDYSDFLSSTYQGTANGVEPGLGYLFANMSSSSMTSSGFLRPDAFFVTILLSTGDDTSNRNICSGVYAQNDGWVGPCDLIRVDRQNPPGNPSIPCGQAGANPTGACNNYQATLDPYKTYFRNFKGAANAALMKFYSIVAAQRNVSGEGCLAGANTFIGQRYQEVASYAGGRSYDICTTPIPSVLSDIATNLTATQLNLYTRYLFMDQEPDPSTIVVYRDAAKTTVIPHSNTNGWAYAGKVNNVLTTSIGSPSATPTLNRGSGWAVRLYGSGIVGGNETPVVEFRPAGLQNNSE